MKTLLIGLLALSAFAQGIGVNAHGIDLTQNAAGTNGGYQRFAPVSYNPHGGSTCFDIWGNQVQQPMPTANLVSAFGANDLFLWNSLSPSMPMTSGSTTPFGLVQPIYYNDVTATGPCGLALPVNLNYGLNTNGYLFARGGLATDQGYFNSIQSLQGGMIAGSYTAGIYYPAGTVTACCGTLSVGAYLGGHMDTGHSSGAPASGGIGAVTNPFTGGEGLVAGMIYYDDGLGCERVYSGSAWNCMGGGLPASPSASVQFNNSGVFGGSSAWTWNKSTDVALITGSATSGYSAPAFSSSNTGANVAFTTAGGTLSITGAGNAAFQAIALTNGITVDSGAYGLNGSGVLTVASGTGVTFNCTATSSTLCVTQSSGTWGVTGAGNAAFQSIALTNGITVDSGAYGLNGSGVLSVASCAGCGLTSFNTRTGPAITLTAADVAAVEQDLRTVASPTFANLTAGTLDCTATGSTNCVAQNSGTFSVTGAGNAAFQSLALTNGITVDSGAYGLNGSGVLSVASCTGCGLTSFNSRTGPAITLTASDVAGVEQDLRTVASPTFANITAGTHSCTATGTTNCVAQSSGTFTITGAGNAAFQSVALTNGLTAATVSASSPGSSIYSLTIGHGLTISASGISNTGGLATDSLTSSGSITTTASISASNNVTGTGGVFTGISGVYHVGSTAGITSSTCSHWTGGICDTP